MGTRSLTFFRDTSFDEDVLLAVIYKQYDGYPTGYGAELKEFLTGFTVTNGISSDSGKSANGMGCLAAQVIAHFKTENGVGGIYMHSPKAKVSDESYGYVISAEPDKPIQLKVYSGTKKIYEGTVADFDPEKVEGEG